MSVSPKYLDSLRTLSFRERVPEPPGLNEEVEAYASSDYSATNRAFVNFVMPLIVHNGHVADMGCGPGDITALLKQHRPDLMVSGVDNSPEMLAYARSQGPGRDLNIDWRLGDMTTGMFAPGSLDFICSNTTVHHLTDEGLEAFLREMICALKPTGGFAIRDLRRPPNAQIAMEWIDTATGDSLSDLQYALFFHSLRASRTCEEINTVVQKLGIGGRLEVTTNPKRYWLLSRASRGRGHTDEEDNE